MICERCKVEVEVTIYPLVPGMEKCRMRRECPKCHCRIFSFITIAEPKDALPPVKYVDPTKNGTIKCERCQGFAKIVTFSHSTHELVCGDCKEEIENNERLAQLNSAFCV